MLMKPSEPASADFSRRPFPTLPPTHEPRTTMLTNSSEKERWGAIIHRVNIKLEQERAMQGSLRGNSGPRYRHTADESAPYETISVEKLRKQ